MCERLFVNFVFYSITSVSVSFLPIVHPRCLKWSLNHLKCLNDHDFNILCFHCPFGTFTAILIIFAFENLIRNPAFPSISFNWLILVIASCSDSPKSAKPLEKPDIYFFALFLLFLHKLFSKLILQKLLSLISPRNLAQC